MDDMTGTVGKIQVKTVDNAGANGNRHKRTRSFIFKNEFEPGGRFGIFKIRQR